MMATTTTDTPKELVFQTCKDFIKANNRGPRISVIEDATGLTQPRVSYYMRQLRDEGRVAYEAGNYESMSIVPQRRARRETRSTKVTVVERRRPMRALPAAPVPDAEHHPVETSSALAAPKAGSALKQELIGVREKLAKEISAFELVSMNFVGKVDGDLLAAPSQAVKDELMTMRTTKQRVLEALDVVIGALT